MEQHPNDLQAETGTASREPQDGPASLAAAAPGLSWLSILRLGLVQASLGAIVVLTNSTLNRVMIVELALAALVPGCLVGLHYGVQLSRPLWGHRSDVGASRTRWILGGLALLATSGTAAAATTLLFEISFAAGLAAATLAYALIGIGIGASGTSLLALMARQTAPERRASAATLTWMLMIAGIVVTSIATSAHLEPYSHQRLVAVTAVTGLVALALSALALVGLEKRGDPQMPQDRRPTASFARSAAEVWQDREARWLTLFVFLSMLAYATQDLILEPFAGLLFGMTPAETTRLSGLQHGGVLLGMACVGVAGGLFSRKRPGLLKMFIVTGCLGSGLALAGLACAALLAPAWPLEATVFLLGLMNGTFSVAAIGTMMVLAGAGKTANEGMRMGVWGAAQALSFGLGGLAGTVVLTLGRWTLSGDGPAFALVFVFEAALFLGSAAIALGIGGLSATPAGGRAADRPARFGAALPAE
ncbi:MFS transporter [Microvirga tunisiensis]|uniref:MFS transporter n=1 Tax=Pannonibacter tanglangensis TaxID=2750084 RepID=A0A7X5J6R1_9HYPH|nr:BCD family MFS transporter [Pannonibacter sp. XCT-53]NBN76667.1 MFS transporter [Pannonibacter sp. XCT-53]